MLTERWLNYRVRSRFIGVSSASNYSVSDRAQTDRSRLHKSKCGRTLADVLLLDGTNVKHALVKDSWCWCYRTCAPGSAMPEKLETEAREA
jgi:endonuclease YncB( thermonuclease family)